MAGATYGERRPPAALAGRVACLWWVRPDDPAGAPATVLPDGCVDLVWHAGALTVAGPDTAARVVDGPAGPAVGVRLRPGAALVFGESAAALRDRHPTADEVWGADGRRLAERMGDADDDRARLVLLVDAVALRVAGAPPMAPAVEAAVAELGRPGATVAGAARAAGVGERLLRRRFLEHVGYGPKTLARVLRLQRVLELAIGTDEDLAGIAVRAGYADQAHLSRETRALADATPAELVAARRP